MGVVCEEEPKTRLSPSAGGPSVQLVELDQPGEAVPPLPVQVVVWAWSAPAGNAARQVRSRKQERIFMGRRSDWREREETLPAITYGEKAGAFQRTPLFSLPAQKTPPASRDTPAGHA